MYNQWRYFWIRYQVRAIIFSVICLKALFDKFYIVFAKEFQTNLSRDCRSKDTALLCMANHFGSFNLFIHCIVYRLKSVCASPGPLHCYVISYSLGNAFESLIPRCVVVTPIVYFRAAQASFSKRG